MVASTHAKKEKRGLSASTLCLFGLYFTSTTLLSSFPAVSLAALVGFALYGLYVCLAAPSFLLKYFIVLFGVIAGVVGCFSCEFLGGYLPELRTYSSFSGSLPLLVLNYFLFLTCLYGFDRFIGKDNDVLLAKAPVLSERRWFKWIHAGVMLMIILMFLHVLPNPSFAQGSDRFSYTAQYLTGIWRYFHSASMILFLVPLLAVRFGYKKSGIFTLTIFCLYLFWTGVKFSGFYSILGLASLVFYDKIVLLGRRTILRIFAGIFFSLGLLVAFAVFAHSFAASSDTSADFFFNRTAQQSQLWWSTYDRYSSAQGFADFVDELDGLSFGDKEIRECQGNNYGIYKMMYLNAPDDLVNIKLAMGSRYTEASYPSIYYYFGSFGTLVFSIITALVTALLVNVMIGVMHEREVLSCLACFVVWKAWATFRSMFLFSSLLDPAVLVSIAILFFFPRSARGVWGSSEKAAVDCDIDSGFVEKPSRIVGKCCS